LPKSLQAHLADPPFSRSWAVYSAQVALAVPLALVVVPPARILEQWALLRVPLARKAVVQLWSSLVLRLELALALAFSSQGVQAVSPMFS
jgi:hypothetical protein